MRILLADDLPEFAVERLGASGASCDVMPWLTADDLPDRVPGYEVLIVRSTVVDAAALEAAADLGLVVRAGAGTNNIDCSKAAELGIIVCNVPGRNAIAVAELALGLMLAVDRHIACATADARVGVWNKRAYSQARGLHGSTLGILGMGAIGLAVAERAVVCGMRVLTTRTPAHPPDTLRRMDSVGVECMPDLASLLAASDIVSLHVPAWPTTVGMVDSYFLAAMKPDAVLINTSRGSVVLESALIEALDTTGMRAGIDVFEDELAAGSGEFRSALASHPKVTVTHHVGASTLQAQTAVAEGVVEVVEQYRRGAVSGCVNLETAPARAATLVIRHSGRGGALGRVLLELSDSDVAVGSVNNRVLAGSRAAVAAIDAASPVDSELLDRIRGIPDVIRAAAA